MAVQVMSKQRQPNFPELQTGMMSVMAILVRRDEPA